MIDNQGHWAPDLSPKGYEVLNDYSRFLMLSGCRKSSKTINSCAKICRHMWENNGAVVAIVGKEYSLVKVIRRLARPYRTRYRHQAMASG
jgi:hypothetical protein